MIFVSYIRTEKDNVDFRGGQNRFAVLAIGELECTSMREFSSCAHIFMLLFPPCGLLDFASGFRLVVGTRLLCKFLLSAC